MSSFELKRPNEWSIIWNPLYMGYEVKIGTKWYLLETLQQNQPKIKSKKITI